MIQAVNGATIRSAPVQTAVTAALAKVAAVPGVESVVSPYAKTGAAQVSKDSLVAFARVTWDSPGGAGHVKADATKLITAAESADGGRASAFPGEASRSATPNAPAIGFSVPALRSSTALVILLIVFGGAATVLGDAAGDRGPGAGHPAYRWWGCCRMRWASPACRPSWRC